MDPTSWCHSAEFAGVSSVPPQLSMGWRELTAILQRTLLASCSPPRCLSAHAALPPALEKGSSSPSTGFNHPDSLPAAVPGTPMLQLSLAFPPNRAGPRHGSPRAQSASLSPRLPSGAATSSPAASLRVTWGGIWVRDELNHTLRAGPRCKGSLDGGPAGSHLLPEIPARGSHIKGPARGCN